MTSHYLRLDSKDNIPIKRVKFKRFYHGGGSTRANKIPQVTDIETFNREQLEDFAKDHPGNDIPTQILPQS